MEAVLHSPHTPASMLSSLLVRDTHTHPLRSQTRTPCSVVWKNAPHQRDAHGRILRATAESRRRRLQRHRVLGRQHGPEGRPAALEVPVLLRPEAELRASSGRRLLDLRPLQKERTGRERSSYGDVLYAELGGKRMA
ncbi:hypothetical protein NUW54_g6740 [Trametes sanguinea]|uniref:Uncharacterized protein n=1 Tax=Trametes sanguinea TaxID=158606 RepID=A0ACC1PT29_9APHY|nr:hypothetical protein NUW54_g6740 [Trametes sanguinea]